MFLHEIHPLFYDTSPHVILHRNESVCEIPKGRLCCRRCEEALNTPRFLLFYLVYFLIPNPFIVKNSLVLFLGKKDTKGVLCLSSSYIGSFILLK